MTARLGVVQKGSLLKRLCRRGWGLALGGRRAQATLPTGLPPYQLLVTPPFLRCELGRYLIMGA